MPNKITGTWNPKRAGKVPRSERPKTAGQIKRSNRWCCKYKLKLSMEEAAVRSLKGNYAGLETYLCQACGWVHFGHKPRGWV